jgi:uncharacterized delta-60 repeat protein
MPDPNKGRHSDQDNGELDELKGSNPRRQNRAQINREAGRTNPHILMPWTFAVLTLPSCFHTVRFPRSGGHRTVPFRRAFVLVCLAALALGAVEPAYATPGALDPSFGSGGLVTTDVGGNLNSAADGVTVQPVDGRIVVGGSTQLPSGRWCFFVARYLTDGSSDASFGSGGITITDLGSDAYASAMTLTADGHILVAGVSNSMMTVEQYRADGSLETSFGSGGVTQVAFPSFPMSEASAVQALSDGTILLTGSVSLGYPSYTGSLAMARLTASGSLDTRFGTGGLVTTSMSGTSLASFGSTVTAKGKIVLVGWSWPTGSSTNTLMAQYLASGSVDRSFNRGKPKVVDLAPGQDDSATSVTITSAGTILALSGVSTPSGAEVGLVSLQPNGSFTRSFGSVGIVVSDPTIYSDQPRALLLQSDGKILVAGSGQEPDVARFTSSGALDPTFGSGGVAMAFVPSGYGQFNGLAARPDGSVIAAGVSSGETLLAAFQTT